MKTYKEAVKHCQMVGAKNVNYEGRQAIGADIIGKRWCFMPETLYNWAQKHGVKLTASLCTQHTADEVSLAVLEDRGL